jgi:hypothetical protein
LSVRQVLVPTKKREWNVSNVPKSKKNESGTFRSAYRIVRSSGTGSYKKKENGTLVTFLKAKKKKKNKSVPLDWHIESSVCQVPVPTKKE